MGHVQIRRDEIVESVDRDRKVADLLDDGAADVEAVAADLLRPLRRRELTLGAHRAVAEGCVGAAANRADAGLRDDVDERRPRLLGLGGKLIPRDVDRLDLRLGRQLLALKAVDADDRARTRDVVQLARHFIRVVRERLDLLLVHGQAERPAGSIGPLIGGADRDRFREAFDHEDDHVLVVAAVDAEIAEQAHLEPRELGAHAVAPHDEVLEADGPFVRGLRGRNGRRLRGRLQGVQGDGDVRDHGSGLIGHRDQQLAPLGRLGGRGKRCHDQSRYNENKKPENAHI